MSFELAVQTDETLHQCGNLFLFLENGFRGLRIVPEFGILLGSLEFAQAGDFAIEVKDNL